MTAITECSAEYLVSVCNLMAAYLDRFDESERLAVLLRQLSKMDLSICDRKNMVGHLTASALLLDGNKVLLIHHRFLDRWLQPGGHLEPDETPSDGALRELSEETGLKNLALWSWHIKNGLPIDIDSHKIPLNQNKNESEHLHHDFQYVFTFDRANSRDVSLQTDEVSDFKWLSLDELRDGSCGLRLARVADKLTKIAEPA